MLKRNQTSAPKQPPAPSHALGSSEAPGSKHRPGQCSSQASGSTEPPPGRLGSVLSLSSEEVFRMYNLEDQQIPPECLSVFSSSSEAVGAGTEVLSDDCE
eukprot:651705-Amphidinium_carterae.1